ISLTCPASWKIFTRRCCSASNHNAVASRCVSRNGGLLGMVAPARLGCRPDRSEEHYIVRMPRLLVLACMLALGACGNPADQLPPLEGGAPGEYRLGTGDTVRVITFDDPRL